MDMAVQNRSVVKCTPKYKHALKKSGGRFLEQMPEVMSYPAHVKSETRHTIARIWKENNITQKAKPISCCGFSALLADFLRMVKTPNSQLGELPTARWSSVRCEQSQLSTQMSSPEGATGEEAEKQHWMDHSVGWSHNTTGSGKNKRRTGPKKVAPGIFGKDQSLIEPPYFCNNIAEIL